MIKLSPLPKTLTAVCLFALQLLPVSADKKAMEAPLAFTVNCSACHMLDKAVVGPSLVDISRIYKKDESAFVKWCIEPGKKRPNMPQMPSMAHVSEDDLKVVYDYVISATKGVKNVKVKKSDFYAKTPSMTARPRIIRTFIPDAGPASLYIALPTAGKHNLAWDTDLCRLRYITTGEPNAWNYYKANGNDLASMGEKCYTEETALFNGEAKPEFKGYSVKDGLPTFVYMIGTAEIQEAIRVVDGVIQRVISSSSQLPSHTVPDGESKKLHTKSSLTGQTLTVSHTPQ